MADSDNNRLMSFLDQIADLKTVSFIDWLKSVDSNTNWYTLRDEEGLPGIERRLCEIACETGRLSIKELYDVFFVVEDPWYETNAVERTELN